MLTLPGSYTYTAKLKLCCAPGFGVTAKSTSDCRKMEPSGVVVFHQSDVGEYLRAEDDL